MLWGAAVSVVLFAMSIPINSPQSDIFFSMVSFAAVMFGGGAAYHMISLMAECPQNEENYEGWLKLVELLIKIYMGFFFGVMCLGLGLYIKGAIGIGIVVGGYLCGFIWATNRLVESHKYVKALIAKG